MNLQDNPTAIAQSGEMPRRTFAALRACEGIPTEALEAGVVKNMLKTLQTWQSVFDALFAAGYPLHQNGKAINHSALNAAGDMTRAAIARATGEKP